MRLNLHKHILNYLFVSFCLLFCVSGCSQEEKTSTNATLYSVEDATGTKISFTEKPHKIISMSISTDEILLDLVDKERILALSYLADDPGISNVVEKASYIEKRVHGKSAEPIMAMQPDLVLAPDFLTGEVIQSMRDLGLKVYVYKTPKNLKEVRDCIKFLASAVGEEEKGTALLKRMDDKVQKLKEEIANIPKSEAKRIILVGASGIYHTPNSSFDDICESASTRNALKDTILKQAGYVSQEEIVRLNPDAFILAFWNYDGEHDPEEVKKELLKNPSYQSTRAIKENNVYVLPAKHLLSLSQYIVCAAEDIAHAVYLKK